MVCDPSTERNSLFAVRSIWAGVASMLDEAKLKRDLGAEAELIVGDIDNTVDGFRERLTRGERRQ